MLLLVCIYSVRGRTREEGGVICVGVVLLVCMGREGGASMSVCMRTDDVCGDVDVDV